MTAPSQTPEAAGLEPCPFCGGEAWLNDYEAKYSDLPPMSRAPQCRSCGASLGYLTTPAKATEAWNRRVTAASAQARIAELERWQAAAIRSARIHDENIREFDARATAAEARADRLANSLKADPTPQQLEPFARKWCIDNGIDPDAPKAPHGEWPEWYDACGPFAAMWRDLARAALQQETQP